MFEEVGENFTLKMLALWRRGCEYNEPPTHISAVMLTYALYVCCITRCQLKVANYSLH